MATTTGSSRAALSLQTQSRLDGILSALVTDLRGVIPEHEVVLSLVSATRSALLADVAEQDLPQEVDAAVRATWGLAIAATGDRQPATDGQPLFATPMGFAPTRADSGVGLLQIGSDLRITAMDDEAAGVLGVTDRRLAAISALTLVEPSFRPLVETLMQRTGEGSSWAMVVPMRHNGGYRPTLVATATISGAFPRIWACAVTRVEDGDRTMRGGTAPASPDGSRANHCLIECAVDGGAGTTAALSGIADELRGALGPGPKVHSDGDRISVLLPVAGGTLEALHHGDRIARLVRTLCESIGAAGTAEVRTDLLCVGDRSSLGHLLAEGESGG